MLEALTSVAAEVPEKRGGSVIFVTTCHSIRDKVDAAEMLDSGRSSNIYR